MQLEIRRRLPPPNACASARILVSAIFHNGGRRAQRAERRRSQATRELHDQARCFNAHLEPNTPFDHKSSARPGVLVLRVPVRCVTPRGCPKSPWPFAAARATRVLQAQRSQPGLDRGPISSRDRRAIKPRATDLRPITSVGRRDSLLGGAETHQL